MTIITAHSSPLRGGGGGGVFPIMPGPVFYTFSILTLVFIFIPPPVPILLVPTRVCLRWNFWCLTLFKLTIGLWTETCGWKLLNDHSDMAAKNKNLCSRQFNDNEHTALLHRTGDWSQEQSQTLLRQSWFTSAQTTNKANQKKGTKRKKYLQNRGK